MAASAPIVVPSARVWIRSSSSSSISRISTSTSSGSRSSPERCLFGKSVFDAMDENHTDIIASSESPSPPSTATAQPTEALHHYDRRSISLWEDIHPSTIKPQSAEEDDNPNSNPYRVLLSAAAAAVEEDEINATTNTIPNDDYFWPQLPLGRARQYSPLGATACPTTVKKELPNHPNKPYTQLAVVGLVMDPTGQHVLLTRRPSYMRSFPGAWVLPGGGFDAETDASLYATLEREIREETGLELTVKEGSGAGGSNGKNKCNSKPMCLWESCYPTDPYAPGPIKGHYLVVFHQAYASSSTKATTNDLPALKLQEVEVESAMWLSLENFKLVLARMKQQQVLEGDSSLDAPSTSPLKAVPLYKADGSVGQSSLDTLVGIYPQPDSSESRGKQEQCGIAQGSLFALEELLLQQSAAK